MLSPTDTLIIGACLPPYTLDHLLYLKEALTLFQDQDPMVLRDLRADIGQSQNPRSHQVADLLMDFRQMDLLHHFRQRGRFWHMNTWYQMIQGRLMRAKSDNILGKYRRRLKMVVIRGIRNYPSYQFSLRDSLIICPTKAGHHCGPGGLPAQMVNVHRGRMYTGSYQTNEGG